MKVLASLGAPPSVAPSSPYTVVFDFRHNFDWTMLLLLIPVVMTCLMVPKAIAVIRNRDEYGAMDRIRYIGGSGAATLITSVVIVSQVYDQVHERMAFHKGDYRIVEGYVKGYNSADKTVWFNVGGTHFEVSCCWASMRFHQTPSDGGEQIIRSGEWLRITYISPEEILRIERRQE